MPQLDRLHAGAYPDAVHFAQSHGQGDERVVFPRQLHRPCEVESLVAGGAQVVDVGVDR
jgi:hypothetical protein